MLTYFKAILPVIGLMYSSIATHVYATPKELTPCKYFSLIVTPQLGVTSHLTLNGRVLSEPPAPLKDAKPSTDLSVSEAKDTEVMFVAKSVVNNSGHQDRRHQNWVKIGTYKTDDEGYLTQSIDPSRYGISKGDWLIEWILNSESISDQVPCVAGVVAAKILDPTQGGVVIRSDVDMTYLKTPLHSTYSLIKLIKQKGSKREIIEGIPEVYQLLQNSKTITVQEVIPRPLSFLSGSPQFFTRSLLARFNADKLQVNGLSLKPFKNIVGRGLKGLNFGDIKRDLKAQIGFKLDRLLTLRMRLPNPIQEVLIGDNTESDRVIYTLYHTITAGLIKPSALSDQLSKLGLNYTWRTRVLTQATRVLISSRSVFTCSKKSWRDSSSFKTSLDSNRGLLK